MSKMSSPVGYQSTPPKTRASLVTGALVVFLLALTVGAGIAWGDEQGEGATSPETQNVAVTSPTNEAAAYELPHKDLSRDQALELLEGVFSPALDATTANPAEELHAERYVSNTAAVIDAPGNGDETRSLVESTLPLWTHDDNGKPTLIDLSLEHQADELQPDNPLVQLSIPQSLGDGIGIPEGDINIELLDAPADRAPSTIDDSMAFYPNVATDTDFVVVPTQTGVETYSHLRSADAPTSQSFRLNLPAGAVLSETELGGVEAKVEDERLLNVLPPSTIDAAGTHVPTTLDVAGDILTVHVSPTAETAWPVIVDPYIEYYPWYEGGTTIPFSDWTKSTTGTALKTSEYGNYGWGLYSSSTRDAFLSAGEKAEWIYHVPRWTTDPAKYGSGPTSWIADMWVKRLAFITNFDDKASPSLRMGIWRPTAGAWASSMERSGTQPPLLDTSLIYHFENKTNLDANTAVGNGIFNGSSSPGAGHSLYVGNVIVEVKDSDSPAFGSLSPPTKWMDKISQPIGYSVSDTGLGVSYFQTTLQPLQGNPVTTWDVLSCKGGVSNPCPRTIKSGEAGSPTLTSYDPQLLPTGIQTFTVTAKDVVENASSAANVQVKIDHTPPAIALSGTLTEQASLGTMRSSYQLHIVAEDGTTVSPQSGAASVEVKVDGTTKYSSAPGCVTQNCSIARDWTLTSSEYSKGTHQVEVIAKDGAEVKGSKSLSIVLNPDTTPPVLSLSGSLTEQGTYGTTRPRWNLSLKASDGEYSSGSGVTYATAFGALGSAAGQFNHPADVATDQSGNLWVVDKGNSRLQKFNSSGQFIAQYGSAGSANGQLSSPGALAIDSKGNIWVADTGNNRIEKFSATGAYITKVGTLGAGNGQFSGPEGITVDSKNNVWVSDTYNGRVQKFDENGIFVKVVSSYGAGTGQLGEPTGIDAGPANNIWIADWQNNRVAEFSEAGTFIRQFGTAGTGNGQFNRPDAIDADSSGQIWVGDEQNSRVQVFNETGSFLNKFGSNGSGAGQFRFGYPFGLEVNGNGKLWIADAMNHRVQAWSPSEEKWQTGVVSTVVKVDGVTVDSTSPGCATQNCSISRSWYLENSKYSAGTHSVEVIATDGAGLTTKKTLSVTVARDTKAPQIETWGAFFSAPEGWVEQEPFNPAITSSDTNGYGVTSLSFKIDGSVVKATTGTCLDGGCGSIVMPSFDTSTYSGGAHAGEIVATDGAGNTAKKQWTINVDPEGHVSTSEAIDTIEAVQETSDGTVPVASSEEVLEPEQIEAGLNPGFVQNGSQITSTGVPDTTTLSTDPNSGITIEGPDGALTITPVSNVEPVSTTITAEVAAVQSNVHDEVDTIVRPEFNGAQTFQTIRGADSPEEFSWDLTMAAGQTLVLSDEQVAEVKYENGSTAFLIGAEKAHDATGAAVPTSLSVQGNTLTLHVLHRNRGFVYPIVAGQAFETSYTAATVIDPTPPPPEKEIPDEWAPEPYNPQQYPRHSLKEEKGEKWYQPPPEYSGRVNLPGPWLIKHPWRAATCAQAGCDKWEASLHGYYWKEILVVHSSWNLHWAEPAGEAHLFIGTGLFGFRYLLDGGIVNSGLVGPSAVSSGSHEHLTAFMQYWLESWPIFVGDINIGPEENCLALQGWIWANGWVRRYQRHWENPNFGRCYPINEA